MRSISRNLAIVVAAAALAFIGVAACDEQPACAAESVIVAKPGSRSGGRTAPKPKPPKPHGDVDIDIESGDEDDC